MSAYILGIGTAVPKQSVSQELSCIQAAEYSGADQAKSKTLAVLYKRTTIANRSLALAKVDEHGSQKIYSDFYDSKSINGPSTAERMQRYSQEIASLANVACKQALQAAGVDGQQITHLVTASCTGFAAPGFDLQLIKSFAMKPSVSRTHIGFMGCHAALNALRVAQAYSREPNAVVLVCAAEICSLHFQYGWSAQTLVSNSLFADGAAALVLSERRRSSSNNALVPQYLQSRSHIIAETEDAMSWTIGDNGFLMHLENTVPGLIEANLPGFVNGWLAEHNLSPAQIKSWAVHPGGPRVLDAVQNSLHLSAEKLAYSRAVLREYGNMSSPTVLFILQRILKEKDRLPCVMLAFGPGLTVEAALITGD